jgi:hypothetical protein
MKHVLLSLVGAFLLTCWSSIAGAQIETPRPLSDDEIRSVIGALLKVSTFPLSEDPSCKADLNRRGSMSIAEGLAVALFRAATEKGPVSVNADCFVRRGYPLSAGQEYCSLAFALDGPRRGARYGLLFIMDWTNKAAIMGSVECF